MAACFVCMSTLFGVKLAQSSIVKTSLRAFLLYPKTKLDKRIIFIEIFNETFKRNEI